MLKWLPTIVAALAAIAGVFVIPAQTWIAAHPAISAVVAGVSAILSHLLPSPCKSDATK